MQKNQLYNGKKVSIIIKQLISSEYLWQINQIKEVKCKCQLIKIDQSNFYHSKKTPIATNVTNLLIYAKKHLSDHVLP